MTILDLINTSMKRVSSNHGGEFHGPCPLCGGVDRFHVWPEQGDKGGTFWCRGCGKSGDGIEFLKQIEGLSCPDAFGKLDLECESITCPAADKCRKGKGGAPAAAAGGSIPEKNSSSKTFSGPTRQLPAEIWREKAAAFLDACHQQLLDSPDDLEWLRTTRGITLETAIACRLGTNSGDKCRDYYRPRASWGLPENLKGDGTPRKLWIPCGLVIPRITAGTVDRLRVRRPDAALKADPSEKPKRYIVVPGSTSAPLILPCKVGVTTAWIIVESELDAILLWQLVGDLVGVMAMGNSSARPDVIAHELLTTAKHISVALDYDARNNAETGRYENPGGAEVSRFWLPTYPQAERTPLVGGKDPCDAWLNGVDLRAWTLAGLPPAYRIRGQEQTRTSSPVTCSPDMITGQKNGETPQTGGAAEPQPDQQPRPVTRQLKSRSGQVYWVTESREEWQRLSSAGKIVFSAGEIQRIGQMMDISGDQTEKDRVAELHMAAKRVFPGSYVSKIEDMRPKGANK